MSAFIERVKKAPKPPLPAITSGKVIGCAFNIAHIAIGAVHLDDCPRKPYIPIYLVVMGVFGLMLSLLSCLPCTEAKEGQTPSTLNRVCTGWNSLVSLFITCWFICGNVWVYRIYEPIYEKNATTLLIYCNKTVYLYAFWTITLVYILIGAALVGGCCVLFCFFLCGRADPDD